MALPAAREMGPRPVEAVSDLSRRLLALSITEYTCVIGATVGGPVAYRVTQQTHSPPTLT